MRLKPRWIAFVLAAVIIALVISGCGGGGRAVPTSREDFDNLGKEMSAIEHQQPTFTFTRTMPRRDAQGNPVKDASGNVLSEVVTLSDQLNDQWLKDQVEKTEALPNSDVKSLELGRLNFVHGYLAEFQKTTRGGAAGAPAVYGDARTFYENATKVNTGYATQAFYRLGILGANNLLGTHEDSYQLAKTFLGRLRMLYGVNVWDRAPQVAGQGGAAQVVAPQATGVTGPTLKPVEVSVVATELLDHIYRNGGGRDATYYSAVNVFMGFFNRIFGKAYGTVIALFFLALLVKLITLPLTTMAFRGMRDMQRIQPMLKELQEKYKDDRQKQAEEQMRIMKEHNVKPLGGCLPTLIQLPIFIIVYQAVQLYLAQFSQAQFIWIHNLARPDLPLLILYAISLLITQKLTATPSTDPQQQAIQNQMTYMMPIFMVLVLQSIASAFVLYWFFLNVLSSAHQYYLMRQFKQEEAALAPVTEPTTPPSPKKKKGNRP